MAKERNRRRITASNRILYLSISVFIHLLLLLGVLLLRTNQDLQSDKETPTPLKSYLWVKPKQAIEVNTPQSAVIVDEEISRTDEKTVPVKTNQPIQAQPKGEIKSLIENVPDIKQKSELAPVSPPLNKSELQRAINQYTQQLHQLEVEKLSEQSALAHRKQLVSPTIEPLTQMTKEERAAVLRKIEVDCAQASKKGVALIAGLFGGTIECRDNSNFQEYIDKRLKK